MRTWHIFLLPLIVFVARLDAENVYDSIAWYDDSHLSYTRVITHNFTTECTFFRNGHVASVTRKQGDRLQSYAEYYPNGKKKFDTVCSANYYNWSNRFYPDGSKQRFVQEQFESSYKSSHTRFEIIDWDVNGEVSHVFIRDDRNIIVANESYPFRRFSNIRWYQDYDDDARMKESGFYVTDPFTGQQRKYGTWMKFYPNGKLQSIGLFMNDVPWGLHYTFDSTGVQLSLTNYVSGKETPLEQDDLASAPTNWKDGGSEYIWKWRNFTNEGLVLQSDGKLYFFYRGCILAEVNSIANLMRNHTYVRNFGIPYMQFWSTWNKYSVTFTGNAITRETEEINGSWSNTRQYSYDGRLSEISISSRNEHISFYPNGLMKMKEHPLYYSYDPTWYFELNRINMKQDTIFYWDENGRLTQVQIFGLYGQLFKTVYRSVLSMDSVIINPMFCHVFIEPIPGKKHEILDNDVLIPGYVKVVNEKGYTVKEGEFTWHRVGKWITYNPETGNKLKVENYLDGASGGPGIYKEYYGNGKLSIKGRYNTDGEKTGVWKNYSVKGRVMHRERYRNGELTGLEYCRNCCRSKRGRYRMRFTLHVGKRSISFPNCHRRIVPFD